MRVNTRWINRSDRVSYLLIVSSVHDGKHIIVKSIPSVTFDVMRRNEYCAIAHDDFKLYIVLVLIDQPYLACV